MSLVKLAVIALILVIALVFRFHHFYQTQPKYAGGDEVSLSVILQEEPELTNRGQKFRIKTKTGQYLYVTTEAFPRYHFGQVINVSGKLEAKEYEGRMLFLLSYPTVTVEKEASNPIAGAAADIRNQTKTLYESTLPPISASLLMGIVFGAREQFPDNFWTALQTTGVLHVIAASGMNVTFVSAALLFTLEKFMRRQLALILGCGGIIFYLFLVGFEPSILRASIMGILAFGASLLGRQHMAAYAVLVSGYVMLLWQPSFLFDIGFQLSFTATLGIIYIKPLLDEKSGKLGKYGGDTITTTLAAQLGTLPILLGVFGQFGLLSVLVNAIVLWTIPIIMLFGSLAALIGLVFAPLGELLLYLSLPFLLFFEWMVVFFGSSDWVMLIDSWHWTLTVGYYFLLCSVIVFKKPRQKALSLEESFALEKY